jgi:hypothetical protein
MRDQVHLSFSGWGASQEHPSRKPPARPHIS